MKQHLDRVERRVAEQTATVEQLQLEMTKRKQQRDVAKKMLLDRIRMLQNRRDDAAAEELLSVLTSLDNILSQEMRETLNSSERVLADGSM